MAASIRGCTTQLSRSSATSTRRASVKDTSKDESRSTRYARLVPEVHQAATVADGDPAARSQVPSCSATTAAIADRDASRIITPGSARSHWKVAATEGDYHATQWRTSAEPITGSRRPRPPDSISQRY